MAKGLLLGNGINARIGIEDLSVKVIAGKFFENIKRYSDIFKTIFDVQVSEDFLEELREWTSGLGIEILAGNLYNKVKSYKKEVWTCNHEYHLQDLVTCICLTSIFFNGTGKIKQIYDEKNCL